MYQAGQIQYFYRKLELLALREILKGFVNYKSNPTSGAYFCHLAPFIFVFFATRQSQNGGGMAQCPPEYVIAERE